MGNVACVPPEAVHCGPPETVRGVARRHESVTVSWQTPAQKGRGTGKLHSFYIHVEVDTRSRRAWWAAYDAANLAGQARLAKDLATQAALAVQGPPSWQLIAMYGEPRVRKQRA